MRMLLWNILVSISLLASCSPTPVADTPITHTLPALVPTSTATSIPCTLLHFPVTQETALGAEFEGRGHISGPTDAPVTIIAFSDYQCLQCAFLAGSLKQLRLTHPDDLRIIYLHAPQNDRDKDNLAIQAVEAAAFQDKFWEMHDLLFMKQSEWSGLTPTDFKSWIESQAFELGMDKIRYISDFNGNEVAARLQQAIQFTAEVQSFSPPRLFINSTSPYTSLADFASLDTVVRLDALIARQFSACPPISIDPINQYIIHLHTRKGDLVIQLFPEKAFQAVNNFVFLARNGWYDGITFYRVLPGERVMTGDPSETGLGNPGYLFETEVAPGLHFDQPGLLAMDNNGPGTNGSRFFITLAAAPQLDGQYTIFGKVLSGLEILSAFTPRDPQPGIVLPTGEELISVTIEEK